MKKKVCFLAALFVCSVLLLASCGHKHTFGDWTVVRGATCAQTGQLERICDCGEVETSELPMTAHTFGEWKVVKESTCAQEGSLERTCTCGASETGSLPLSEHVFGEWVTTKQATCVETGVKERTCACGESQSESLPVTDHTYSKETVAVKATCTAEGTGSKVCSVCGHEVTSVIPATGHTWKSATCTKPKTCSVCGVTEGAVANHSYAAATCTQPQICSGCGKTQGTALGCTAGTNGNCIRCGKSMIALSSVLSAPFDSIESVRAVAGSYYAKDCYKVGNFRFIFNSADGIILSWGARNTSNKTIKYITFTVNYYNSVADPARDDITHKTSYTAKLVGPIGPGKAFYLRDLIGYGSGVAYGKITDVTIEYMDGTSVSGNYGHTTWHNSRSSGSPNECYVIEK